jgi:hypothetical protein
MEDTVMLISATPYREPRFATVNGRRMAYLNEGVGDTIVFQHGNPTSSYVWRNIMPHCEGLGRLIACDLIGMGRSDKLPNSRPERYSYHEQRDYLFAVWEQLNLETIGYRGSPTCLGCSLSRPRKATYGHAKPPTLITEILPTYFVYDRYDIDIIGVPKGNITI